MAKQYGPHLERLQAVAASGGWLAIGGRRDAPDVSDSSVHLLQLPRLDVRFSAAVGAAVGALGFADDDWLLAGTSSGELLAWNLHAGDAPVLRRPLHGGALEALAPIPGARRVVSVGADGVLCIVQIDADGGGYQARIQAQRRLSAQALHAVVVDVAGNRIVAAGADSTIYVLALADASNAEPRVMPCGERGVFSLALSGDGRIVAGCGDGSIRVLFLEGAVDEEDRSGDDAHKGAVRGLAFSAALLDDQGRPLARRLFSVDSDGELKIWTLDNRRKPRTIAVGSGARALALSARSADAGPEKRGGVLAVVTENRRLWLSPVNQDGYPQDKGESWDSRLQRLLDDLAAQKPTAATLDTLGQLAEDEARQALERVLGADQRPPFRAQAAQLLAQRRRSRPALARALNDDHPSVRQAAFAALQVLAGDTPLAPLQAALASRHEDIRLVAVQRLPELRKASPLVPRLLGDSLKDKSEKVRETALDALIALEPDAPGASLRAAFERGSADVRQAVLIRLSRAGEAVVAERAQLLGQALNDETYEVRRAAFWIAVAMQPRLAARLDEASADFAKIFAELQKRGAAVAFAAERGKSALADTELEPLFTALAARQSDIALQGAVCLALLGDSRASGALLQLSRESNPAARRMVTRLITSAAIALADPQLRLRLLWLLNDTDPQVRAEAFDGLAKLAEPEGPRGEVELAAAALRTQSPDIRARALQALIKHGATAQGEMAGRIDGLLGDALDDEAEVVRREALRTLWAWYSKRPEATLRRAADSRHGDVRRWAVDELLRQPRAWAREMLIERIGDAVAEVGLAAYEALTKEDKDKKVPDTHLAALNAPTAEVRLAGLKGALEVRDAAPLRSRMVELLKDERADVFSAAIEAFDKLLPDDAYAFALAFDSPFYLLRVRAAELCGKRRDTRAVGPMQGLLGIPQSAADRPSDSLRRRAAGALADVGDAASIPFLASLLKDDDALVREQGARGLATACRSGQEQPLLDALDHPDLAVRSWAADGLARLGDTRALAVLAGTQRHDHAPIRRGALYSFVALGSAGMQGILQGLEDPERELQELAFAVVVARDIALARAQLPPDLLLSALTAAQPEIRYAAARTLEARLRAEDSAQWAPELVGPRQPEKAGDMRNWPEPAERPRLLNALINALAGHAPARRYAATQVFALRPQPEAFWREAKRLAGAEADQAPQTGAEGEASIERKTGWIRSLFSRAKSNEKSATQRVLTVLRFAGGGRAVPARQDRPADADLWRLVFGAYAGLVRQAPVDKGVDDAQRVRRDCIARLATLVEQAPVGRDAVLPVLRQALNDPHHLVRQAALETLRSLYPKDAVEPLALALGANAGDVGRNAFDRLLAVAATGKDIAAELARGALNAPHAEVRLYALEQLPRAYPVGSLEPWLLALDSRYDDVRLAVVDRLLGADDARVAQALNRALESAHDDLRLRAAVGLAQRGEARALEVLAAALRNPATAPLALESLVALAHARSDATTAAGAAQAIVARLEDDPDQTAQRAACLGALARIGAPEALPLLLRWLQDKDQAAHHGAVLEALLELLRDRIQPTQKRGDGRQYPRYREALAVQTLAPLLAHGNPAVRGRVVEVLGDVEAKEAEALLAKLLDDRDEGIRAQACGQLAQRVTTGVAGASLEPLTKALTSGRRELLLAAAEGLAEQRRPEAFQPLLLAFSAGTEVERKRAIAALGKLADRRALEYLEPLVDANAELAADDRALAPDAAEALGAMLPKLDDADARQRLRATLERLAIEARGETRWRALSGLRRAADERSRGLLERIVADPYEAAEASMRAAAELGELGNAASEPVLEALLHQGRAELRQSGLAGLRKLYPTDATRVNLLALRSAYAEISQPAARYLARQADPATLAERLGEIDDAQARRRLRRGLIRRQTPPLEALRGLLQGEAPAPRAEAAWIAGGCGAQELAAALQAAAARAARGWRQAHDEHLGVRAEAEANAWWASLWAARQLKLDIGQEARVALADSRPPNPVRRAAIHCLAQCGNRSDSRLLAPLLTDADPGIRSAAADALASLDGAQAGSQMAELEGADGAALRPMLRAALPNSAPLLATPEIRQISLPVYLEERHSAGLMKSAGAAGKAPARLSAIAALGRIGDEQAKTTLADILANRSEDGEVRAAAFKALRRLERNAARVNAYTPP